MATKKLRAQLETLEAENSCLEYEIHKLTEARSTMDNLQWEARDGRLVQQLQDLQ